MPTTSNAAPSVESLLRVVQARDAEVAPLKLMVDKLKAQLLRTRRAQFGPSSEQLDGPLMARVEGKPLDELAPPKPPSKSQAANACEVDRKLPAHLPRDPKVHRPPTTADHHDASGESCGCTACGGRLRQIGHVQAEQYLRARRCAGHRGRAGAQAHRSAVRCRGRHSRPTAP